MSAILRSLFVMIIVAILIERVQLARADETASTITNSLGMKLAKIPAGEFMMGNPESLEELAKVYPGYEKERFVDVDEFPRHKVKITKPFYLAIHETTIEQFKKFVEGANFKTEAERDGTGGWGYNQETKKLEGRMTKYSWRNPGFPQALNHPVVDVTWQDAVDFCRWLSKKEGQAYRLPTEAEWEYACRGGADTRYNFGNDPEQLAKNSNTYDADGVSASPEVASYAIKGHDGYVFTAPVGSYPPNAFGLHDMHGNVWEWCSDWYGDDYYANSPSEDPQGVAEGGRRVRRGAAWASWPLYLRSSFRNWNTPQSRYTNLGFRVVRQID